MSSPPPVLATSCCTVNAVRQPLDKSMWSVGVRGGMAQGLLPHAMSVAATAARRGRKPVMPKRRRRTWPLSSPPEARDAARDRAADVIAVRSSPRQPSCEVGCFRARKPLTRAGASHQSGRATAAGCWEHPARVQGFPHLAVAGVRVSAAVIAHEGVKECVGFVDAHPATFTDQLTMARNVDVGSSLLTTIR